MVDNKQGGSKVWFAQTFMGTLRTKEEQNSLSFVDTLTARFQSRLDGSTNVNTFNKSCFTLRFSQSQFLRGDRY